MIKSPDISFFRYVLISSLIILAISVYPILKFTTHIQTTAIIYAYLLGLTNAFAGYVLNELAMKRGVKSFLGLLLGGMMVRIFLALSIIIILINFANAESITLVSSFFFFYIVFMCIEIFYIHKKKPAVKMAAN